MTGHLAYQLAVVFAGLAGAVGGVLAVLAWRATAAGRFNHVLPVLALLLGLIALSHPLMLVFPRQMHYIVLLEPASLTVGVIASLVLIRNWNRPVEDRGGSK